MCYKNFKQTSMQPWPDGCFIPSKIFNQSVLLPLFISYNIYLLWQIIHDVPTWWNVAFNTNLVIISPNVEVPKYKPVYFLQLINLMALASSLYLLSIKRNSNMANTFNNEGISHLCGFRIFAVCSIMVRKGNHFLLRLSSTSRYHDDQFLFYQKVYTF